MEIYCLKSVTCCVNALFRLNCYFNKRLFSPDILKGCMCANIDCRQTSELPLFSVEIFSSAHTPNDLYTLMNVKPNFDLHSWRPIFLRLNNQFHKACQSFVSALFSSTHSNLSTTLFSSFQLENCPHFVLPSYQVVIHAYNQHTNSIVYSHLLIPR